MKSLFVVALAFTACNSSSSGTDAPAGGAVCGNGVCEAGETSASCPADCSGSGSGSGSGSDMGSGSGSDMGSGSGSGSDMGSGSGSGSGSDMGSGSGSDMGSGSGSATLPKLTVNDTDAWCSVTVTVGSAAPVTFSAPSHSFNAGSGTNVSLFATPNMDFLPVQWTGVTTMMGSNATYLMGSAATQSVTACCALSNGAGC